MSETALVVAEKLDVAVLFTGDGMDKILKEIEAKAMAHVPDISTDTGRKDIASMANKVARSKTLIDGLGKDLVSDWKKKAKAIDDHRKKARDFLDDLKVEVRKPLTGWEAEETVKKEEADRLEREKIEKRIFALSSYGLNRPFFEVAAMDDDASDLVLASAKHDYEAEQKRLADEDAARKAESERLENLRVEIMNEKRKVDEANVMAAAEKAAIEVEKKAFEDEKLKEQECKDREAFELRVKADAAIAAVEAEKKRQEKEAWEAKEKADQEAAEKIRQEALKPDKEKLVAFAEAIFKYKNDIIPDLPFKSAAYPLLAEAEIAIEEATKKLIKKAKEL